MGKLGRIHVASFQTGDVTSAASYPAAADRITLPAGALVLRASLSEQTAFAGGTNVQLKAGSTALMSVLATGSIADYNAFALTVANQKLTAPAALEIATTGTYTAGNGTVHVEYVIEADE
tara:strand:+ start:510 stop:869 length:360 start_codon:yes stop_codon:yes gene_type:complete